MAFYDDDDVTAFSEDDETPTFLPGEEEEGAFGEYDDEEKPTVAEGTEPGDNKTFLIAVAILIGFLVLAMAALAVFALYKVPAKRHARETEVAAVNAQNTAIALGLTATAEAASWTATPTATPSATPTPAQQSGGGASGPPTATPTPVVAPITATAIAPIDPTAFALTATAIAATNAAAPPLIISPTALANTGFADDVGLPGMVALAALLIVVIFLARRLRQSV